MERRASRRVPVQIPAEIEITGSMNCVNGNGGKTRMQGTVITIDISLGGFCAKIIHSPTDTERSFTPAMAYILAGKEIMVFFPEFDITIWGKVVRVDPETMHMAVIITRVSDIMGWRELCSQAICAEMAP